MCWYTAKMTGGSDGLSSGVERRVKGLPTDQLRRAAERWRAEQGKRALAPLETALAQQVDRELAERAAAAVPAAGSAPAPISAERREELRTVEGYANSALDDGDGFVGDVEVTPTDSGGVNVRVTFPESMPAKQRHYWLAGVTGELRIASSVGSITNNFTVESVPPHDHQ